MVGFSFFFSCKGVFCWQEHDAILYGQSSDMESLSLKTPIKHLNGVTKKEFGSKSKVHSH